MLTSKQIQQFQANGFLNGGQVLSNEEVETLRAEVMRVIDERERNDIPQPVHVRNMSRDDSKAVWQIVNIWEASGALPEAHRPGEHHDRHCATDRRQRASHLARSDPVQAGADRRHDPLAPGRALVADHQADDRGDCLGGAG